MAESVRKKKLIETSIPLTAINAESAREKSLRHGLPSTLHLYWARRPLATARSVLFAQLVDDPSAHPDRFPTVEDQDRERTRLHQIMVRLAKWENRDDANLYREARAAIEASCDSLPAVVDPFAGGGSIPLEAQRLGLEAHASDLNPLAVIINKALIEIPSRFSGSSAVNPDEGISPVNRAEALAEDIRYYGRMLRERVFEKVGHLYPTVTDNEGVERTVIAWIWARTVTNPNPANPVAVPLVRSWWLSKKKGREAWVKPIVNGDGTIRYEVQHNADGPAKKDDWTIKHGKGATSIVDGTPFTYDDVRKEGKAGRLGSALIAIVAEGSRGRVYCSPNQTHIKAADTTRPDEFLDKPISDNSRWFSPPQYGMPFFTDLFTDRQLTVLTEFADTIPQVREQVLKDALNAGMPQGEPLDSGGSGAEAYADAISVYLSLAVSRQTDRSSSICSWDASRDSVRNVFARQAIPMTWDYAEANPFSTSAGNYLGQIDWVAKAVQTVPATPPSTACSADASTRDYRNLVVSTDPPYYDNISYSDLSDYFYVWLRYMLRDILPSVTRTELTPKLQELVANPYRHGGKDNAEQFFIDGFNHVFAQIRKGANSDFPMTVYYAYKQQDSKTGISSGWHALLDGLINAGWEITATWPVRSELNNRMLGIGTNALASSIVLACRPRPKDAEPILMSRFIKILNDELKEELRTMMESNINPVDLSQAAIGPGISVYSRYARIRKTDGSDLSIKQALEIINRTVDEVLGEKDLDYDGETRFSVRWYEAYGWNTELFGIADQLTRSTNTSPEALKRGGAFDASGGKARLLKPEELTGPWDPRTDANISLWEVTVRLAGILAERGMDAVAPVLAGVLERFPADQIKQLSYRIFKEAERRSDAPTAEKLNSLISSWDELRTSADRIVSANENEQTMLDLN
ncbi:DUF1156 domain-containing protein [Gleimia hominis]|uniref:DUF1156 domain-containing protein n=1 Tax=Gleimia hominis TaxID=595468 RepID=A0ABU3I9G1_9ACTO|nr:DUF1156 domain-containing protein [Gleimia hominis]MDT3766833.1 DUF1156 domain-containing protein [Gleimia hominis]